MSVFYDEWKTTFGWMRAECDTNGRLTRLILPTNAESLFPYQPLKKGLTHSPERFEDVRNKCISYFDGKRVDFRSIPINDDQMDEKHAENGIFMMGEGEADVSVQEKEEKTLKMSSSFASKCRHMLRSHVGYGETTSYGELAEMCGYSRRYARAVARAMASNPVPLVVPCHRVVTASGRLSGFSAEGGVEMKKKMLVLEGVKKIGLVIISC
eukprot:TRINITY_DN147_c0_g1_i1.p1 TRINITY_DN147_c0_g1~~TRINITY_DN147_c0_g1_i1.p1  ORF type:complete len:211 (-),score=61.67 TRINITY_DN147_c0_g1_i1:1006-1638(-)